MENNFNNNNNRKYDNNNKSNSRSNNFKSYSNNNFRNSGFSKNGNKKFGNNNGFNRKSFVKKPIKVKFSLINQDAKMPFLATPGSACYDVFSIEDKTLLPNEFYRFSTGLSFEIEQKNIHIQVFSRSGLNSKQIHVLSTGIVDNDYRGDVSILLKNDSDVEFKISKGDRIGQIGFTKFESVEFNETKELETTERGEKGFGSTGQK